jgi:hypothetical protein
MTILRETGPEGFLSVAFRDLKSTLQANGSCIDQSTETALKSVLSFMVQSVHEVPSETLYSLASLDPGAGKTEATCAFLRTWKSRSFLPAAGALIVLSTRKEIESCIARSGLQACDFAIQVAEGHELNDRGSLPQAAPVLFTTQEKLRRLCAGQSFAEVDSLRFKGRLRQLRIWDEAFLPAAPAIIRKDTIVQPLADLRPVAPEAAASLDALGDSLSADSIGEVVEVPHTARNALAALSGVYRDRQAERWAPLQLLAGREAAVVNGDNRGLCLAGASEPLPADFAPALILDASGRVRETYSTMEAAGLLQRLPSASTRYTGLRINHWDRAASRSALKDPKARRAVLEGIADAIKASGPRKEWLIVYPQERAAEGYSLKQELAELVDNPDRLSFLHWGNHHGTNKHRHIRKVAVIGLWTAPRPAYSALHVASGGPLDLAADKATIDALKAGEHRHNLLQAICRASVRKGTGGTCGDCEVYLVGKLGPQGHQLLRDTFPGVKVDDWKPEGWELAGSALKVAQALEGIFAAPGVQSVDKATLRAFLGYRTGQALSKVLRREDFRTWASRRAILVTTRAVHAPAAA